MKPLRWSSELGIPHLELLYFSLGRKHKKAHLRESSHPGIGVSSCCGKNCLKVNTVTLSETERQAPAMLSFPTEQSRHHQQQTPALKNRHDCPLLASFQWRHSGETQGKPAQPLRHRLALLGNQISLDRYNTQLGMLRSAPAICF